MVPAPFVVKNFISDKLLAAFQAYVNDLKNIPNALELDEKHFKRLCRHNDPNFKKFHYDFVSLQANKIFGQNLRPSYNFLSCYLPGKGECPVHTDRPPCYLTIDLCLSQSAPWPLYVNSSRDFNNNNIDLCFDERKEMIQEIKNSSAEYILMPGDALCYSGTHHAHWRKQIPEGNFCDLVFFHFVAHDYVGELD